MGEMKTLDKHPADKQTEIDRLKGEFYSRNGRFCMGGKAV